jgi:hypothetical protein
MAGVWRRRRAKYAIPERLADVLALMQVLALDKHTHRSEQGLTSELQGRPLSGSQWTSIAEQHREFFRVREPEPGEDLIKAHRISLVARHVLPENAVGGRDLPVEFVGKLLDAAINLHDRELNRRERAKHVVPIVVAIIVAAATIAAAILKSESPPAAVQAVSPVGTSAVAMPVDSPIVAPANDATDAGRVSNPDPIPVQRIPASDTLPLQPLRVGGDVKAPVLITRVEPKYPPEVRRIAGAIILEGVVTKSGDIRGLRVIKGG